MRKLQKKNRFTAITYTTIDACGGEARKLYGSSGYKDELVRATTWLFFATGNRNFLDYATTNFAAAADDETTTDKGIFYCAEAMVAGPDQFDDFSDEREKTWFTEPSIAGNAGLVAALIAHHDPPTRSSASNGPNLGLDIVGIFEKVHLDS
ncbi:hypothetical protein J1N35_033736 [Gossypium stocksii]|uniref:cellulase n=1 Tax=Gossypium stocksii TaxID=47602 RepID=A0A9D3ZNM4_9ROSI|nr:hypothetical protein J1N35_033736 [Gossypium stocksii]